MKINTNDSVRVRLTEHGRRLHREHWNEKVGDAYPSLDGCWVGSTRSRPSTKPCG